jgi:lipid-binding SYLF domain-containing protein
MNFMRKFLCIAVAAILALSFSSEAFAFFGKKKSEAEKQEAIEQEKADIRNMVQEILARLYKIQPGAKTAIAGSAGYAVFSNFGMKIFFAGGGSGKGIVFDKENNTETFMKMVEAQAGLGLGVKKFSLIWVFMNHEDVDEFINSGWEFGGQATAAAKLDDKGEAFSGAMSVSPGIWLYQLTDEGIALELTGKGTKYYKDKNLN